MSEALVQLAEHCEAATGPDRETDAAIFQAIGAPVPFQFANKLIALEFNDIENAYFARVSDDMQVRYSPPAYTASLDAAMTLVPEGAFWSITMRGEVHGGYHACCQLEGGLDWREGATPALAMTAAALWALAKEPTP